MSKLEKILKPNREEPTRIMESRNKEKSEFFIFIYYHSRLFPLLSWSEKHIESEYQWKEIYLIHEKNEIMDLERAFKVSAPLLKTIQSKLNFMGELNVHKSFLLRVFSVDIEKIANIQERRKNQTENCKWHAWVNSLGFTKKYYNLNRKMFATFCRDFMLGFIWEWRLLTYFN